MIISNKAKIAPLFALICSVHLYTMNLFEAIEAKDAKLTQTLILNGANVNQDYGNGNTPLHSASCTGDLEIVTILIAAGAHIDQRGISKLTPLHIAASHGYILIVKALLNAGARMYENDVSGTTPLHMAASGGHATTISTLIAHANEQLYTFDYIDQQNRHGATPLQCAINYSASCALIRAGATVPAKKIFDCIERNRSAVSTNFKQRGTDATETDTIFLQ